VTIVVFSSEILTDYRSEDEHADEVTDDCEHVPSNTESNKYVGNVRRTRRMLPPGESQLY